MCDFGWASHESNILEFLVKSRHTLPRLVAFFATLLLVCAPVAAHADDIPGTPGDDNISGGTTPSGPDTATGSDDDIDAGDGDDTVVGDSGTGLANPGGESVVNGGDDEIEGEDGDDTLTGDGDAVFGGVVNGGDDEIKGGDGDDFIQGDGTAVCALFFCGNVNGGDDVLSGGDGNDIILGDGVEFCGFFIIYCIPANGGDDVLNGNDGDDALFGNGGSDLLCGGEGDDLLIGGTGSDVACAVDDEDTVDAGDLNIYDLAANDEQLNDEFLELAPLIYSIEHLNKCTEASIDPDTGVLTYSASKSGSLTYGVTREDAAFTSLADLMINVTGKGLCGAVAPASNPTPTASADAVLPDTGAPDHMLLGIVTGALMALAGAGVLVGERRRINA
jgi:hypothetical protein